MYGVALLMIYDKKVAFDKSVTTVTDHFLLQEFVCKCGSCQMQKLDLMLPLMLEDLRKYIGGRSIRINSGYRCSMWNKSQGGKSDSEHLSGEAVDCYVTGMDGLSLAKAAYHVGFRRIGVSDAWCHLGTRELAEDIPHKIWVYGSLDIVKIKQQLGVK